MINRLTSTTTDRFGTLNEKIKIKRSPDSVNLLLRQMTPASALITLAIVRKPNPITVRYSD